MLCPKVKKLRTKDYCSSEWLISTPSFSQTMSSARDLLLRLLYFTDNFTPCLHTGRFPTFLFSKQYRFGIKIFSCATLKLAISYILLLTLLFRFNATLGAILENLMNLYMNRGCCIIWIIGTQARLYFRTYTEIIPMRMVLWKLTERTCSWCIKNSRWNRASV